MLWQIKGNKLQANEKRIHQVKPVVLRIKTQHFVDSFQLSYFPSVPRGLFVCLSKQGLKVPTIKEYRYVTEKNLHFSNEDGGQLVSYQKLQYFIFEIVSVQEA